MQDEGFYDFHTHTVFSDGGMIPAGLMQRAIVRGCLGLAITDHVDRSNIDFVVPRTVKFCERLNAMGKIKVVPGVEITHVAPEDFDEQIKYARSQGVKLVLVHGETLVEPVIPGTNRKALECEIDILAHPGLITPEEAKLAAMRGIYLEITTRRGHSLTNGHVVRIAREAKAHLVLNTDSHAPEDLISTMQAEEIARGAGLAENEVKTLFRNSEEILKRVRKKS